MPALKVNHYALERRLRSRALPGVTNWRRLHAGRRAASAALTLTLPHTHTAGTVGLLAKFGAACGSDARVVLSTTPATSTLWRIEAADPGRTGSGAIAPGSSIRISVEAAPGCRLYITAPAAACSAACTSANRDACEGNGYSSLETLHTGKAAARQAWVLTAQPGGGFSLESKVRRGRLCMQQRHRAFCGPCAASLLVIPGTRSE